MALGLVIHVSRPLARGRAGPQAQRRCERPHVGTGNAESGAAHGPPGVGPARRREHGFESTWPQPRGPRGLGAGAGAGGAAAAGGAGAAAGGSAAPRTAAGGDGAAAGAAARAPRPRRRRRRAAAARRCWPAPGHWPLVDPHQPRPGPRRRDGHAGLAGTPGGATPRGGRAHGGITLMTSTAFSLPL